MNKDDFLEFIAFISIMLGGITIVVCIILIPFTLHDKYLYGGKNVECIGSDGTIHEAVINDNFRDILLYFSYISSSELRFKVDDGIIYGCRGLTKIS